MELRSVRITIDSVLVRDNEPTAVDVDGHIVIMSVRAGYYFDLNRVGTEIWRMLAEPRRVSEIFDSLSTVNDVDPKTLCSDVIPFLQNLVTNRLVRVV